MNSQFFCNSFVPSLQHLICGFICKNVEKFPLLLKWDTEIQKKILNNCSKYLKNNGTIVYSTCSILKDENEEVVNEFLKENSEYYIKPEETRNILPNQEEDGFFICKIYKK